MPETTVNDAHHADNQRRFIALETKIDANTAVTKKLASDTEKLATDTADLLVMWQDAGVFFKWMRKAGAALAWCSKVIVTVDPGDGRGDRGGRRGRAGDVPDQTGESLDRVDGR